MTASTNRRLSAAVPSMRSAIQSRSRSRRGRFTDVTQAEPLLEDLAPDAVIADKGYDSDAFVETLEARDITPVIPPKANRKEIRDCDFALYCERNLVERFFNKIKHYRAIATRFDKLANTFLAGVLLVCVVLWLN
jgi:transposase